MSGGNIKGAVFRAASRAALREEGERGERERRGNIKGAVAS